MSDGVLEIQLTQSQLDFLLAPEKYPFFCAGYASGKSRTMGLKGALDLKHSSSCIVGFYEPYYDLIRTVAWPNVMYWLTELGVSYTLNKQDNAIYTSSSGVGDAYFRSMDNVEALVGYETYTSHIDELDTMPMAAAEKAFMKIMGRNRQAPEDVPKEYRQWQEKTGKWECVNKINVYSTPEGFRFCHKMWDPKGDNARSNPEFKLYRGRTLENSTLAEDYIQGLRNTYPKPLLEAYMEGNFVNLESGTVYYNFDREKHNTTREIQKDDILHIGVDFNVQNTCGIVFVDDKNKTSIVAEIIKQYDTPALIKAIKASYSGHRVIVYPDSSGVNRTAQNASSSSIELLKEAGFEIRAKSKNPLIKDRVTSVVKAFEEDKLFVNVKNCPELTRCLEQQAYNDKGEPDKDSGVDHPLDGMGYRVFYSFPIRKPIFKIPFSFAQKR